MAIATSRPRTLRFLAFERGLSLTELARVARLERGQVSRINCGLVPSDKEAAKLAKVLGLEAAEIRAASRAAHDEAQS